MTIGSGNNHPETWGCFYDGGAGFSGRETDEKKDLLLRLASGWRGHPLNFERETALGKDMLFRSALGRARLVRQISSRLAAVAQGHSMSSKGYDHPERC